jgi:hypothetical protein
MMREELESKPSIVIEFNEWQQQRGGPPWWPFMNTIYERSVGRIRSKRNGRWRAAKLKLWEHFWRLKVGHSFFLWLPVAIFGAVGLVMLFAFRNTTSTPASTNPVDIFLTFLVPRPVESFL